MFVEGLSGVERTSGGVATAAERQTQILSNYFEKFHMNFNVVSSEII